MLRQEHKAGEKLFVDYAGDTIPIYDPHGGPELRASLFVAVLGASNYTYAEATENQQLENWIGSHIRTFEFMNGVAELLVPDNARTGVSRACRYEPSVPNGPLNWPSRKPASRAVSRGPTANTMCRSSFRYARQ